jgi:hypothetical protein
MSKTKMHTGRLLIGYIPADYYSTPTGINTTQTAVPTDFTAYNFKSAIWDLREGNVFDFECPFISSYSYLPTVVPYGTFFIYVIEPLAGPPSVATSVPYVVEVAGCSDLEYQVPSPNRWFPAPTSGTTIISQAGDVSLGSATSAKHALLCSGDTIKSVKQLLNVACPVYQVSTTGSVNTAVIKPWYRFNPTTWSSGIPVDNSNPYTQYIVGAYAMGRGGTMVDGISFGNYPQDIVFTAATTPNSSQTPAACNIPIAIENAQAHFKFPYYSMTPRSWTVPDSVIDPRYVISVNVGVTSGETPNILWFVRASDDSQLGYWVGPPPISVSTDGGNQSNYQAILGTV